jgi:hypothetical protein
VMPPTTPGNQLVSPGRAAVSPSVERGGMWAAEMPTPPTSGTMCGIGCNINVNTEVRFCGALFEDLTQDLACVKLSALGISFLHFRYCCC